MRNILSLTFIIFLMQPAWALGYSEHINYLSKVTPAASASGSSFADMDLSTNPDLMLWLKDADTKLNPSELGTYDAELLLNISTDGHIRAISVSELRDQNLDEFKLFIAKLQTIQFKSLPSEISSDTVFKLDAGMLYLERHRSYLTLEPKVKNPEPKADPLMLLDLIKSSSGIKVELLEPGYIDYPHIGEALVLQLKDLQYKGLKLYAQIIDVEDRAMLVKLHRVDDKLINLVFKINRPSKDSRSTLATVVNSGLGSAAGAGIAASVASNGILPGVLALTNMAGTLMKEREELLSFNLVRGDEVILVKNGVRDRLVSKSFRTRHASLENAELTVTTMSSSKDEHNTVMHDLGTRLKEK